MSEWEVFAVCMAVFHLWAWGMAWICNEVDKAERRGETPPSGRGDA